MQSRKRCTLRYDNVQITPTKIFPSQLLKVKSSG